MKTLYLDLFSGISGDMFIGALVDLGVNEAQLEQELAKLGLEGYHLHFARALKGSISGVKFDVHLAADHHHHPGEDDQHAHVGHGAHSHHHGHAHAHSHEIEHTHDHDHQRSFKEIKKLISRSALSEWVKAKAVAVFQRIAAAEGKIHGLPPEEVHFHEVGAIDSIVDVVGACVGLEALGKPLVLASQVVDGNGWINCAHGRFPIPAPATLSILGTQGIALSQCNEPNELVTPTGAALLAELAQGFGPMRDLAATQIGFGLGTRELKTRPNVLRAVLGETKTPATMHDWETDTIAVLETNLDDIRSEVLGHFVEQALAAGALDVFHTPIQMKKSRPGILLTVLCAEVEADRLTELMLTETSAFGVRRSGAQRRKLARKFSTAQTPFGEVAIKIGLLDGKVVQRSPEFESCKQVAALAKVPIKAVYDAALKAVTD